MLKYIVTQKIYGLLFEEEGKKAVSQTRKDRRKRKRKEKRERRKRRNKR